MGVFVVKVTVGGISRGRFSSRVRLTYFISSIINGFTFTFYTFVYRGYSRKIENLFITILNIVRITSFKTKTLPLSHIVILSFRTFGTVIIREYIFIGLTQGNIS